MYVKYAKYATYEMFLLKTHYVSHEFSFIRKKNLKETIERGVALTFWSILTHFSSENSVSVFLMYALLSLLLSIKKN